MQYVTWGIEVDHGKNCFIQLPRSCLSIYLSISEITVYLDYFSWLGSLIWLVKNGDTYIYMYETRNRVQSIYSVVMGKVQNNYMFWNYQKTIGQYDAILA